MPYQIRNGIVYGSSAISLTQAQYDALSESEKKNGTVYYIYDSDAVISASDVELGNGTVEDLAGSVATIETSPATAVHAVGDFILWNGQLYTVTAAIAVGETLTVGSNITATTVGSELTALTNGLNDSDTTYVRFPDGTMLVHITLNNLKSGDRITYPKQFVSTPHVFFSTNYNTGTTIRCIFTTSSASNTGFDIYAWDTSTNAVSTSTTLSVNILAVGRWK